MQEYKIGIVGGSGFVGSHLTKYLSMNFNVKVLDVKPASTRLGKNASFETCDIRNYSDVLKSLSDIDIVIHAAVIQIPQISENKKLAYEVNVLGTQNVCKAVSELENTKGMILTSSWHTIGERGLNGVIDEEFGFRPDKVEERARLYALSKMAQEAIVRFYSEMSDKIYGVLRMGTVLGEGMPEKTAANIFITKGLRGESITPYKDSMYRPMLYVDIDDVCKAYAEFAKNIIDGDFENTSNSLSHIVNVYYPEPITILELATVVRDAIAKHTNGKVVPSIVRVDQGKPLLFTRGDKAQIKVDVTKAKTMLRIERFTSPAESIEKIVRNRLGSNS